MGGGRQLRGLKPDMQARVFKACFMGHMQRLMTKLGYKNLMVNGTFRGQQALLKSVKRRCFSAS